MKLKFLLTASLFSCLSTSLFAISSRDSTGVENQNGKKIILHKVEPKENFFSIARKYHVAPKAVIAYNKNLATLTIGQLIKVPTDLPFDDQKAVKATQAKPIMPVAAAVMQPKAQKPEVTTQQTVSETTASTTQYKVSAGETLYAISRRFNTKVADIISMNNLKSTNLTPGQILLVKATPPPAEKAVTKPVEKYIEKPIEKELETPVAKRDSTLVAAAADSADSPARRSNRFGLYEKNEKGVAIWTENTNDLDPNKKLVLHRTAPVGTVIKITNPMTNRTTFAKVVGRFTENENTKDAIMVMTRGVAESLGAIDKRFRVVISYGSPNE